MCLIIFFVGTQRRAEAGAGPTAGLQREGQRCPAEVMDAATGQVPVFRVLVVSIFLRSPDLHIQVNICKYLHIYIYTYLSIYLSIYLHPVLKISI